MNNNELYRKEKKEEELKNKMKKNIINNL